jgi:L-seryl-tRNA(Ser) seleniumtransferase
MTDKKSLLKQIPKVDKLISEKEFNHINTEIVKYSAREVLEKLRSDILSGDATVIDTEKIKSEIIAKSDNLIKGSLHKVINATGVPIHTNLGRSPISEKAMKEAIEIACGYSNLEYDLNSGKRGDRYHHAANYLKILTGAEDALIVNNNAAAVFLILNTFSNGRESIVSRGELIEIGGSFRIPDVMSQSGAILKEVGTTNKTRAGDFRNAVNKNTAVMMKVHKSNYDIVGFSEEIPLDDVISEASKAGVLSYYDAGSGLFNRVLPENICSDQTIPEIIGKGVDIVSFSGDKMLGGVQAGIIAGKKELIDKIKKNQLLRMLRVDKITLGILQSVFRSYFMKTYEDIPAQKLLSAPLTELKKKAEQLSEMLGEYANIVSLKSTPGGGSCPMSEMDSYGVELDINGKKPQYIENFLRKNNIIARTSEKVILDVRTLNCESEFEIIKKTLDNIK